ncbi:FAD-dependent oxidoreductase [Novosphingobium sp.]|uniref:oxidoreductase n=1 Tax=Novosphingobium sp. TaxID=1874826 RepID=UPI00286D7EA1|nr:FAD-dependent oxidoreductase [Novosphingobium sp.]
MALTHVNTPICLNGLEIRNRVVRSAHATGLDRGTGQVSDDLIAYHVARAKGGVGLTFVEILSVHPSTPGTLNIWLPGFGDGYRRLVDTVKPHGMRLMQQLWHAGHNALPLDGSPPWSASDVPALQFGVAPIAMNKAMIDEIVEAYANAARLCEEWGADGLEIHGAHGYLPAQFLSLNANRRDDDYGGSFENRARFTLEVMAAIRASVSRSFVVGIRVGDDATPGGVTAHDYLRLVQMLEQRGLVDFVDISMGNKQTYPKMIGGMHEPAGYELPLSTQISRHVASPTIVIGRFRTLEEADQVIRSGDADMIAMTRATIADPELVRKSLAGHPEQVRPCIGCNQGCVGGLKSTGLMGCAVNPAVGFEDQLAECAIKPVAEPRKVLVIGGGPAGMEAARVAALRGHNVTLFEADRKLGGAVWLAAKAPNRGGIADVTIWLEEEIFRLGVDVRMNTFVDEDDIAAEAPDQVIIATGSLPRVDGMAISNPGEPLQGIDDRRVLSSNDLFLQPGAVAAKTAVVVDDAGHFEGLAAAEYLVSQGVAVTLVARHTAAGYLMEPALMAEPALQRLTASGHFSYRTRSRAIRVTPQGVVIGPVFMPADWDGAEEIAADLIVMVSVNHPNRDLYNSLRERGISAEIVGDANSPRYLGHAIREGHLAARRVA